jgi:uncharacterized protein YlxW (UPF0749 family)
MRARDARLAIGLVALVLGFLIVVQLRAQSTGSGLANLSSQDLTTLIANLNQRNAQLAIDVAGLDGQLNDLRGAQARGQVSLGGLQADLRRIRLWAGLDPVRGQGIIVDCTGQIDADSVNDLLNDLRIAGAEALAVESVRVVPGSVVAGEPGHLSIENTPLGNHFQVTAIGDGVNLTASLTRVGGLISRVQVTNADVQIAVAPTDSLILPATGRDLVPPDARPHI